MALESLPKISPANFFPDNDLIQVYSKKGDYVGVINPSYIKTSPSGVSGAIQFSDGSAFASDASNLFWDNTNKRLGVGTSTPASILQVIGTTNIARFGTSTNYWKFNTNYSSDQSLEMVNQGGTGTNTYYNTKLLNETYQTKLLIGEYQNYLSFGKYDNHQMASLFNNGNFVVGSSSDLSARVGIKGSGSTSATTSLLVQNSSGALSFKCTDDLVQQFNGYQTSFTHPTYTGQLLIFSAGNNQQTIRGGNGENIVFGAAGNTMNLNATEVYVSSSFLGSNFWIQPNASFCLGQQAAANASALLDMRSTTKGFLKPRMTDAQVRAISSPAVGLMAFNTDLDCPVFYSAAGWRKVSHSVM